MITTLTPQVSLPYQQQPSLASKRISGLGASLSSNICSNITPQKTPIRQATKLNALPEISSEMVAQSSVIGHGVATLALCGFSMLGIDASSKLLARQTGQPLVNTVATSAAALLIGIAMANEVQSASAALDAIHQGFELPEPTTLGHMKEMPQTEPLPEAPKVA